MFFWINPRCEAPYKPTIGRIFIHNNTYIFRRKRLKNFHSFYFDSRQHYRVQKTKFSATNRKTEFLPVEYTARAYICNNKRVSCGWERWRAPVIRAKEVWSRSATYCRGAQRCDYRARARIPERKMCSPRLRRGTSRQVRERYEKVRLRAATVRPCRE